MIDRQAAITVSFRLGSELDQLAGSCARSVPASAPCDVFGDERAQSRASGVSWLREIVAPSCLSCRLFGERRSSCHTAAARSVGRVRRGDRQVRVWSSDTFMHRNGARMQEHAALAPDFLPDTQWKCHRSGAL